jgi:hypothetical protein
VVGEGAAPPGMLICWIAMRSRIGNAKMAYAEPLWSSKSYANYASRLSRGQKRFIATLNLPDSHLILLLLRNRCLRILQVPSFDLPAARA